MKSFESVFGGDVLLQSRCEIRARVIPIFISFFGPLRYVCLLRGSFRVRQYGAKLVHL
jgi:hypothetical protein